MSIALAAVLDLGVRLIDKFFPNPEEKAKAQLELLKMQQDGQLAELAATTQLATGQIEINKEEAKSDSIFKSGWRPFTGWTCGLGFFAKFIGGPLIYTVAQFWGKEITLPPIDLTEMLPLLVGMLGLGAYRSYEKVQK